MMLYQLVAVASAATSVLAFRDTYPLVSWSSHTKLNHNAEGLELDQDICGHDVIIVIEHPGLHASDLTSLSPSSHIARSLNGAKSSVQLPYLSESTPYSATFTSMCASHMFSTSLGSIQEDGKHLIRIVLPEISGSTRKADIADVDELLMPLASMSGVNHMVVYSGVPASHSHSKRSPEAHAFVTLSRKADPSSRPSGYLATHQVLTPGLIITLLISLFILLPITLFGVKALSSIKTPIMKEAPKGYNAETKKTQ